MEDVIFVDVVNITVIEVTDVVVRLKRKIATGILLRRIHLGIEGIYDLGIIVMFFVIEAIGIIAPKEPMLVEVRCRLTTKAQTELIDLVARDKRRYGTHIEIAGRRSGDIVVYESLRKPSEGTQELYIHSISQYSSKDIGPHLSTAAGILIVYHLMPEGRVAIFCLWLDSSLLGCFA